LKATASVWETTRRCEGIAWRDWARSYAAALDGRLAEAWPFRFGADGRSLLENGEVVWQAQEDESLLPVAEWYITREWARRLFEHYVVCHAGVLERGGEALLLTGEAGAGKSTLSLALVRQGWRYLGDEYAVIDPRTLEVLPFPNALCVKNGASGALRQADRDFDAIPYPERFPGRMRGAVAGFPRPRIVPPPGRRFPIRWIVFLTGMGATGTRAEDVPPSQAAAALFNATAGLTDAASFRAIAAIARQAETLRLGRFNLEEMAQMLAQTAGFSRLEDIRVGTPIGEPPAMAIWGQKGVRV